MNKIYLLLLLSIPSLGLAQSNISGQNVVCPSTTYTYTATVFGSLYSWTIVGGFREGRQQGASVNVTWETGGTHSIAVKVDGVQYSPMAVNLYSATASVSSGSTLCSGSSVQLFVSYYGTFAEWQKSTNGGSSWSTESSSTNPYVFPTTTTQYRARVTGGTGCSTIYSNVITVNVYTALVGGSISGNQYVCYNSTPATISNITSPSGSTGSYTYRWEYRTTGSWSTIGGATASSYAPGVLTTNTEFRRITETSCDAHASNTTLISVYASLQGGDISGAQTICSGTTPSGLTNSTSPTGGDGAYSYQWEQSSNGSSWSNASGTSTNNSYNPPALSSSMYYRRRVSSCGTSAYSSAKLISVDAASVGGTITGGVEAYGIASGVLTLNSYVGVIQKWQKKIGAGAWTDEAETSATYNYTNITNTTSFRAVVKSGVCSSVNSSEASIIIYAVPTLTIQGESSIAPGTSTLLVASAGLYSYQWYKDNVVVSGTTNTFTVTNPGGYKVQVKTTSTSPYYTTGTATILGNESNPLQDMNYVKSTSFTIEGIDEQADLFNLTTSDYAQKTDYFDGLGRPIQSVNLGASATGNDLIQPVVYDLLGREQKKYLPYAHDDRDGRYQPTMLTDQSNFYQGTDETISNDLNPYAQTVFEPSPLNRPIKQGASGESWQPDSNESYTSPDYTVKFAYELNTTNEVLNWTFVYPTEEYTTTATNAFGKVNAGTSSAPTYYLAGQLSRNKTKDEEGNQVIEYVDKEGKIILKRVQIGAGSPSTIDGNKDINYASTYYIYDDFDNLVCVIPPEATKRITQTSPTSEYFNKTDTQKNDFLKLWAFRYTYDGPKRMIMKQVPGAEPVYMVYDNRDRLVLTQDGNQRTKKQWTFTKYDHLNRPVMTGIYTHAASISQAAMTNLISTSAFAESYDETKPHGYTTDIFPSSNLQVHTVTFYDNYIFRDDLIAGTSYGFDDDHLNGQEDEYFERVNGLVTGTKVNILNTSDYLWSVSYYDNKYRVIQSVMQNHKDSLDRVTSVYDFVGKVMKTKTTHHTTTLTKNITRSFSYDHAGRLLDTWHRIDSEDSVLLVRNEYNELGQLVTKDLHSRNNADFAQQVDYRYNIRGWLASINDPEANDDKLFAFNLRYNNPDFDSEAAQFNGNISQTIWRTAGSDQSSYGYYYDPMNRITEAQYFNFSNPIENGRFNEAIKDGSNSGYDLNGNIKKLQRSGKLTASTYGLMDNLSYTYTGTGNKLTRVDDAIATQTHEVGFKELTEAANEYAYDDNGSMTKDDNKGIGQIKYNYLNLPSVVKKSGADSIVYTYDATGRKLKQQVYGSTSKITDYAGEFIYENDTLRFINHEEGRVLADTSTMAPYPWEYQYHLKDHLGNVRVTFSEKNQTTSYNGTLETANQTEEQAAFFNYGNRSSTMGFSHTGEYSQLLHAGYNSQIGLARSFEVEPGELFDLEVYAKFGSVTETPSNYASIFSALASAFVLNSMGGTGIDGVGAYNTFNGLFSGGPLIGTGSYDWDEDAPKAYLNYLLFDENFVLQDFGFDQISEDADQYGTHDLLSLHVKVKKKGYLYIYLSNENETLVHTYFDDFKIVHHTGVEQSDNYYPFGLTFNSYSRENSTKNNYLYNGKELQDEIDIGWMDYGARMYQSDIGNFFAQDRFADKYLSFTPYHYAANNPVLFVDVNGDSVNVADFRKNDSHGYNTLESDLEEKTGLALLADESGNLIYEKEKGFLGLSRAKVARDANGKKLGSSAARKMMKRAINDDAMVTLKDGGETGVPELHPNTIQMNSDEIRDFMMNTSSDLNNTTQGFGLTFLHELKHTQVGGDLRDPGIKTRFEPGDVEKKINRVRRQLGSSYGQRLTYFFEPAKTKNRFTPFSKEALRELKKGNEPKSSYIKW